MPSEPERTILVVDDEPLLLNSVAGLCEALGFRVCRASDGEAALPHLDAGIDLVITDVRMPRLDGLGLLRRIRATAPHLPVIVMTGYPDNPDLASMSSLGVVGILWRPFRFHELKAMIGRAWPSQSASTPPGLPSARGRAGTTARAS
jgi:CheY-like chemotaxis protein